MFEVWKFFVIVVVIIECDGCFLMVEEYSVGGLCINQLVGYLELGEFLIEVVVCEVLEELVYVFILMVLVGIYFLCNVLFLCGGLLVIYLCFVFVGMVGEVVDWLLDEGIVCVVWMIYDELVVCVEWYCSLLVLCCVDDYLVGQCVLLELVYMDFSVIGVLFG